MELDSEYLYDVWESIYEEEQELQYNALNPVVVILPVAIEYYDLPFQEWQEQIEKNRSRLTAKGLKLVEEISPNTDCHKEIWANIEQFDLNAEVVTDRDGNQFPITDFNIWE